jgi:hypothetical protein
MKGVRRFWPGAVLAGLPLVLYAPFLFGGKVLYWGVYLLQFYPWRQLAVEQIRAGHWPLWNPYLGAGTPLAANLQTAAFYPLNVLFLLMPVERAFGWELALHVALAGLFAYYLGRILGLRRVGALVCGLAYGTGGYVVAHWVFPTIVCAAAWLPLMLALTERLLSNIQRRSSNRPGIGHWILDIALLAVAIAMQLLAGHAQTSFYSLLIVAAFALVRIRHYVSGQTERRPWARSYVLRGVVPVGLALVWGLALAAIQLLPTAELAVHSQRPGTLTDLQFAYELSFWPWRLISLAAPDFFGNPARGGYWAYGTYWEEAAFAGVLPLLSAGLAMATWWRQRRAREKGSLALVPFLAALALASVVLALGNHTPIYPLLFRYVPGFGLFQAPARAIVGYALAIPLLAGIGVDTLRPTLRLQTVLRILVLAGLGMALAGGVSLLALPTVEASFGQSTLRLGLALALAAGLLGAWRQRLRGWRWEALVVLLVAADLLAFGWGLAPGTDAAVYHARVASAGFLASEPPGRIVVAPTYAEEVYDRYVSLESFGASDPAYLQGLLESLLPNLNAPHRLAGAGNYDPLTPGPYRALWDRLEEALADPSHFETIRPLLNLLGARYVVGDEGLPLPRIYDDGPSIYDGGPDIYRNDGALPEAFVVHQARVVEDPAARIEAVLDPAFDARAEVVLSESPPASRPAGGAQTAATPEAEPSVLREEPDRVVIEASLAQAGYLVLTDSDYPGWRATVDGEPAEVLRADHAFRAIQLDPGDHTVVFQYAPFSFYAGAWITAGAIALLALGWGYAMWRRRRGMADG